MIKEGFPKDRVIPIDSVDLKVTRPYVLMTATYCDENGANTYHPDLVPWLSNDTEDKERFCIGTVIAGNKAFGRMFAYAAKCLKKDYGFKCIYAYELRGNERDAINVMERFAKLGNYPIR